MYGVSPASSSLGCSCVNAPSRLIPKTKLPMKYVFGFDERLIAYLSVFICCIARSQMTLSSALSQARLCCLFQGQVSLPSQ